MKKNRFSIVERHSYTIISEMEEIYPETGMKLIRPKLNIKKVLGYILTALICDIILSALFSKLIYTFKRVPLDLTK